MWAFTHLDDPRWRLSAKYLVLRQDPPISLPEAGTYNQNTWAAYHLNNELFIKRCRTTEPHPPSPIWAAPLRPSPTPDFLELETLGPLTTLASGESVSTLSAGRRIAMYRLPPGPMRSSTPGDSLVLKG
jgi:hypothetical protein